MRIESIHAEEIVDSRSRPTIRAIVRLENGIEGDFSVPSGASTGSAEVCELRDSDGHMSAAKHGIETELNDALKGRNVFDQREIDMAMIALDGTTRRERLGGNALIGVSVASAKAAALAKNVPLFAYLNEIYGVPSVRPAAPRLYINVINGGMHTHTDLAFQEYMVVPDTDSPAEARAIALEVMRRIDEKVGHEQAAHIGDEGGVALNTKDVEEPLRILDEIRKELGSTQPFHIALDIAASSFFADGLYTIVGEKFPLDAYTQLVSSLAKRYALLSVEDPFEETDFDSFARLQAMLPETRVVGDDLTTTNIERLRKAHESHSIRALIIKPNQIGTLTETLDTMRYAREQGIDCIVSHRSAETLDSFIADLAYGCAAFGIKTGAPRKPERLAKIDRLVELEYNASHE
jgi:enolase